MKKNQLTGILEEIEFHVGTGVSRALRRALRAIPYVLVLYAVLQFASRTEIELRHWFFLHFGQAGTVALFVGVCMFLLRRKR